MGKKDIWPSAIANNITFNYFFNKLKNIAINLYHWKNLPDTIDERFLELTLFDYGFCVFYKDDVLDQFLCLPCEINGPFNQYNIPIDRVAFANNGYRYKLDISDSVIIWDNYLRIPLVQACNMYAYKLYEIERSIDTNVKLQKFPLLIKSSENQRLTMKNFYEKYDGNQPVIYADKNFDTEGIEVVKTESPYVAEKLYILKQHYIEEWLSHLGVENKFSEKRERQTEEEIEIEQGESNVNKNIGLNARKQACKYINDMFGLNIDVSFNNNSSEGGNNVGGVYNISERNN